MTAAADESWIESSLARLEQLESQREHMAASGQTAGLAEIDEEIKGLYEALESVASDDEPEAQEPANQAVGSPLAVAAPASSPLAQAPPPGTGPFEAAPAADIGAPMSSFEPAPSMGMDVDLKPPRSPLPVVLGVLLLVGGGVGAFLYLNGDKKEEAPAEPTGPATVIKAGEIPEDTQEPNVAKGADADRTQGTRYKESNRDPKPSGTRRSSSGSRPSGRSSSKKDDDGRKFTYEKGKDPLAGVD